MWMKGLGAVWFAVAGIFVAVGPAVAEGGKAIFDARKCINCHSVGGEKGPMARIGGALDGVGSKRDATWLVAYLRDPRSKVPETKMTKQKLTDEEVNAVVEYLLTIK